MDRAHIYVYLYSSYINISFHVGTALDHDSGVYASWNYLQIQDELFITTYLVTWIIYIIKSFLLIAKHFLLPSIFIVFLIITHHDYYQYSIVYSNSNQRIFEGRDFRDEFSLVDKKFPTDGNLDLEVAEGWGQWRWKNVNLQEKEDPSRFTWEHVFFPRIPETLEVPSRKGTKTGCLGPAIYSKGTCGWTDSHRSWWLISRAMARTSYEPTRNRYLYTSTRILVFLLPFDFVLVF